MKDEEPRSSPVEILPLTRKALVDDFAVRSFRDMADQDYIAARLSFRARLIYPSLWQSQQALEKYMKCILLLNRIPAKNVKHDLMKALEALQESGKPRISLTPRTAELIAFLNEIGEYRYFEVSVTNGSQNLIALDRAVWELRRFCTSLPSPRLLNLTQDEAAPKYSIPGGYLEQVLADKDKPGRSALIWNNCFVGNRSRKTTKMRTWIGAWNAPLYMHPEILDDVLPYIFLPGHLIKGWRDHKAPGNEVPPD